MRGLKAHLRKQNTILNLGKIIFCSLVDNLYIEERNRAAALNPVSLHLVQQLKYDCVVNLVSWWPCIFSLPSLYRLGHTQTAWGVLHMITGRITLQQHEPSLSYCESDSLADMLFSMLNTAYFFYARGLLLFICMSIHVQTFFSFFFHDTFMYNVNIRWWNVCCVFALHNPRTLHNMKSHYTIVDLLTVLSHTISCDEWLEK